MAAMLMSPCTVVVSRAPAPAPRKLSVAAAMQFRREQPLSSSVVALPWASTYACNKRGAPLLTCHAAGAKYNYSDLQPNALETCTLYSFEGKGTGSGTEAAPKASTLLAGENWSIMGDKDVIILKLRVGDSPPAPEEKEKFKVETAPGQTGLVIRYTDDDNPASSFNVPLIMPRGYEGNKVKARWFEDWLLVMIAKPKPDPDTIPVKD